MRCLSRSPRSVPPALLWLAPPACARAATPSAAPVPAHAPAGVQPTTPVVASATTSAPNAVARAAPSARAAARSDAPPGWHRLDLEKDGVLGVGSERALSELLAGRAPTRRVIVAVVDVGIDTAHALLAGKFWHNAGETAGNNVDDDHNGFIDDAAGWNFAGGKDGKNVQYDTYELTRLYSACRGLPAGSDTPKPDAAQCASVAAVYKTKKAAIGGTLQQIDTVKGELDGASSILRDALKLRALTADRVRAFTPTAPNAAEARRVWLQLTDNGVTENVIAEMRKAYQSQFTYGLDTMFNPRTIVGDAGAPLPRGYGNHDIVGPDPVHGTHVSGIIAARRDKGGDVIGIAPDVSIMAVRAGFEGDERDQDVASAIRYAADNGANIISMSFGKPYSPKKASVDSAVRYAEAKGVLMIHAAGNDGDDLDVTPSFPTPMLVGGGVARAWIEVGASSWKGGADIPARFSNYGHAHVDIFAPGVDILSTLPNGKTGKESGTSMAAPVVSGVAALLMSYFPAMSAVDIKALMLESSHNFGDLEVRGPGSSGKVQFSALSRSAGVVDAYAAVKLALERERPTHR